MVAYDLSRDLRLYRKPSNRRGVSRKPKGRVALRGRQAHLTKEQVSELRNRFAYLKDPVRYVLVNEMGPRLRLYYNVSDGLYALNEPQSATLFKSRAAAAAVQRVLGRGVRVFRCTTRESGGKRVFARFLR
jgi:hypothetical protein